MTIYIYIMRKYIPSADMRLMILSISGQYFLTQDEAIEDDLYLNLVLESFWIKLNILIELHICYFFGEKKTFKDVPRKKKQAFRTKIQALCDKQTETGICKRKKKSTVWK